MFRADGYGEATFKPEMMLGESGAADQFLGIGTRSSNGDGPCTLYVDDVYVIYKD